jgi:threonylcarbamoyladenosine tRNA methylthiotransferase MtaB
MPQLPGEIVRERAQRLRDAAQAAHRRHLEARIGRRLAVLTERGDSGRAEDFTLVRFGHHVPAGRILPVTATSCGDKALLAA